MKTRWHIVELNEGWSQTCREQSSPTSTACKDSHKSEFSVLFYAFVCCSKRKRGYDEDAPVAKEPRVTEEVSQRSDKLS